MDTNRLRNCFRAFDTSRFVASTHVLPEDKPNSFPFCLQMYLLLGTSSLVALLIHSIAAQTEHLERILSPRY